MTQPTIRFSDFVRRQSPGSGYSHTTLEDEEVIQRVLDNWDQAQGSYRKDYDPDTKLDAEGRLFNGVILVPVDPEGFFSGIVTLKDGDKLGGDFKPRQQGEDPRKRSWFQPDPRNPSKGANKLPAKSVMIVLYHRDVLAADEPADYPCEWEIISINASPTEEATPIRPLTLLANHFQMSGGTETGMTPKQLEAELRVSVEFWTNKTFAGPT